MKITRWAPIEKCIYFIRGQKIMLDSDLAGLYGVTTFNLNKAVQRNRARFPNDFMFQLTAEEHARLIFQIGISRPRHGGRRYQPYAFTQEGIAMLSSVLRSRKAVQVNIAIMRAFVRLRTILSSHADLGRKVDELERKLVEHDHRFSESAKQIRAIFEVIRRLMMAPTPAPPPRIGFQK